MRPKASKTIKFRCHFGRLGHCQVPAESEHLLQETAKRSDLTFVMCKTQIWAVRRVWSRHGLLSMLEAAFNKPLCAGRAFGQRRALICNEQRHPVNSKALQPNSNGLPPLRKTAIRALFLPGLASLWAPVHHFSMAPEQEKAISRAIEECFSVAALTTKNEF